MPTIEEIMEESMFTHWDRHEQGALAEMMHNYVQGKPFAQGIFQTGRVTATFIKILDTHLPEKEV